MEDKMNLDQNTDRIQYRNDPSLQTDAARRTEEAILNEEHSRTVRRRKKNLRISD